MVLQFAKAVLQSWGFHLISVTQDIYMEVLPPTSQVRQNGLVTQKAFVSIELEYNTGLLVHCLVPDYQAVSAIAPPIPHSINPLRNQESRVIANAVQSWAVISGLVTHCVTQTLQT